MSALIKGFKPEDTMAKMEMEQALARMKLGSKKDPNELQNKPASIECRYSLEPSDSKKKAQVLRLGGSLYLSIIMTTTMIYRKKNNNLTCNTLLKEKYMQWRLSGGKSKEDRDSDDDKEVALVATTKKGGETAGNKKGNNPNANKTCNHCQKKGHVEADCWKNHPDIIPKKVKVTRKKQEEKKASTAAAAVESEGEYIILSAVKWDDVAPVSVDIKQGYHEIPIKEEYEFFSDCKDSEVKSEEDDDESNDGDEDSNDNVIKIESNENEVVWISKVQTGQKSSMEQNSKPFEIEEWNVSSVLTCIASTMLSTTPLLESEALWIADATSHVTNHTTGGINQRNTAIKMEDRKNNSITASFEMDILMTYCDKDGNKIRSAELKNIQVNNKINFNLFSITRMLAKVFKLKQDEKSISLFKGAFSLEFDTVIHTKHSTLYCAIMNRKLANDYSEVRDASVSDETPVKNILKTSMN
jgi:hypothetical protein